MITVLDKVLLFQQVRLERYRAADPELTVRRLLRNDSVSLDLYRSKKEKLDLLEAALESCDGNVIIAVSVILIRFFFFFFFVR